MKTLPKALGSILIALAAAPAAAVVYSTGLTGFTAGYAGLGYAETGNPQRIVAQADFDRNGSGDLLWRNTLNGDVSLTLFDGTAARETRVIYREPDLGWKIVGAGDFNGDGRADIVWRHGGTGTVWGMLMDGGTILSQGFVYREPASAWSIRAIGDFAGTGNDNQLLWANSVTGQVYEQTVSFAGGAFQQAGRYVYHEPDIAWRILGAADFDADGRSDILYRNHVTGVLWVLLMSGAQGPIYQVTDPNWKVVALTDFNGDDRADILWRHDPTGQVYMLMMDALAAGSMNVVQRDPLDVEKLSGVAVDPQE